ncbi:MAG: ABC transporter substrate-binding protein [Sphaerobacter sp.]|nr:ABC transporter substrate-binding protein [Sphaerobacter sp.]
MKRRVSLPILMLTMLAVVSLVLAACGGTAGAPAPATGPPGNGGAGASPAPGSPSGDGDPIVIGAAVHLTGWMAADDSPPLMGARLAVKQINEAGGVLGRPLQLIELDGKTDQATVGNAAIQLIEQGAEVMIAPCDFDYGAPVGRAAQEAGIVGLSTCASSPLYGSEALGDLQFTVSMWNQTMSAAAAQFACTDMGWTTGATIVDTTTEYTQSLGEYFVDAFQQIGCTIVSEDTYLQGDMQIDAQIQRLQSLPEPPQVILLSTNMPDYAMMVRELRAAGFATPLMGGDAMDTVEFYPAVGPDAGNNIFISTHSFVGPGVGPAMDEFLQLYQAEYGVPPETAFAAMGWDTVQIIAQAIEAAGTTDGPAMARAMEGVQYQLLSGTLTWSDAASGHRPDKEAFILEVKSGEPTFVGTIKPEYVPE